MSRCAAWMRSGGSTTHPTASALAGYHHQPLQCGRGGARRRRPGPVPIVRRARTRSTSAAARDYENAIAVLVGENPSNFPLAAAPWQPARRRSRSAAGDADRAAARHRCGGAPGRRGQRAHGAARRLLPVGDAERPAATPPARSGAAVLAASNFWSFGAIGRLCAAGLRRAQARVEEARRRPDDTVAQYRQTMLAAFGVENKLARGRWREQEELRRRPRTPPTGPSSDPQPVQGGHRRVHRRGHAQAQALSRAADAGAAQPTARRPRWPWSRRSAADGTATPRRPSRELGARRRRRAEAGRAAPPAGVGTP